jgi:hypothetical protein
VEFLVPRRTPVQTRRVTKIRESLVWFHSPAWNDSHEISIFPRSGKHLLEPARELIVEGLASQQKT